MAGIMSRNQRILAKSRTRANETPAPLEIAPIGLTRCPVAITTSPRAADSLSSVLAAWPASGFAVPRIFCDGPVYPSAPDCCITRREPAIGAWPSWFAALRELVDREPEAPAYLVFQDDGVPAKNAAQYAGENWPQSGVVSLCTVDCHLGEKPGWRRYEAGPYFCGAQALAFSNEAAKQLLCDPSLVRNRWQPCITGGWVKQPGLAHIDSLVGDWAQRTGRGIWLHSPSLVGHVGERASTIHRDSIPHPGRTTESWPGTDFDCTQLVGAIVQAQHIAASPILHKRSAIGTGTHRSGWPCVIAAIKQQLPADSRGIVIDDFVEQTYFYTPNYGQPKDRPWCGIFHHPATVNSPYTPDAERVLKKLGSKVRFRGDLPLLKGAIALSADVEAELLRWLNVPVKRLWHPTDRNVIEWDIDRARATPTLIQVGFFLRNIRAIFQTRPEGWNRMRLDGAHPAFKPRDEALAKLKIRPDLMPQEVGCYSRTNNDSYDLLLGQCVVLTEFYGAAANNVVTECMVRGTPLICNRLPALEDYLGKDYPLFYAEFSDIPALLDWDRLAAASNHLKKRAALIPTFEAFAADVIRFAQEVA